MVCRQRGGDGILVVEEVLLTNKSAVSTIMDPQPSSRSHASQEGGVTYFSFTRPFAPGNEGAQVRSGQIRDRPVDIPGCIPCS